MGRRGRKAEWFAEAVGGTQARESLERRWFERRVDDPRLARMVTAGGARNEPFHRWFHFRQGFSPQLVREFLSSNHIGGLRGGGNTPPVLDPFSGSGTTIIECGRNRVPAIGIEAEAPLVFLVNAVFSTGFPEMPALPSKVTWEQAADVLTVPIHRAALLCAVASIHTSDGRPNRGAKPFPQAFADMVAAVRADLAQPMSVRNSVSVGDARQMDAVEDVSVAAILTSPPYLSRYDYPRLLRPLEAVYRHWYPDSREYVAARQIPAGFPGDGLPAARATARASDVDDLPEAVGESMAALSAAGQAAAADLVRQYFLDMFDAFKQCRRVLVPGGAAWIVVGGARLKDVYIPSDLILAEYAEHAGFEVDGVRVARRLMDVGRKLGRLHNVAPRESVLILRAA